ncbi:hypothetical protein [Arthrobacter woluwensis]|uniref:hypothetical protein n=1 Tax=Arthrobacter woluwensis TaxID=156980 RepID=UPI0011A0173B|nr:hypothetical protein [Arthrobacter woluwensis]
MSTISAPHLGYVLRGSTHPVLACEACQSAAVKAAEYAERLPEGFGDIAQALVRLTKDNSVSFETHVAEVSKATVLAAGEVHK